jgi:hypothetical protein
MGREIAGRALPRTPRPSLETIWLWLLDHADACIDAHAPEEIEGVFNVWLKMPYI